MIQLSLTIEIYIAGVKNRAGFATGTEVVNIACDFVVLLWRRKCQKLVRLKTTDILRSNLLITKKIYLGSVNIIWTTK